MWVIRVSLLVLLSSLLTACEEPSAARTTAPPAVVVAPPAPLQLAAAPVAKADKVKPSKKAPTKVPPASTAVASHLDLSLPPEMVNALEFGQPVAEPSDEAKLPPLFVEKPAEPSAFQLNGKLLTNQKEADYLHSVEGAELQIEFKH